MINLGGKLQLGRLERVDVRQYWTNEATEFTPWLASKENIEQLGEALGIELEVEAQEKWVGPFRADLLCKDLATESWVLIENQLERTDHSHLGQLLTYAAGLDAVTIVWIAQRFTEEHRAALDWLNKVTDERINFFGVEVELWRIGESAIAPRFSVVSKPNAWSKTVAGDARRIAQTDLSPTRQLQLAFWQGFLAYVEQRGSSRVRPTKAQPQHWMSMALGRSGFALTAIAAASAGGEAGGGWELRAEVNVKPTCSKACFDALYRDREAIETEVGEALEWHNPPRKVECRIFIKRVANVRDEQSWPEQHAWLLDKLEVLHRVFSPRIKALDLEAMPVNGSFSDEGEV